MALGLPLVFLGAGTDIDAGSVRDAGEAILGGEYAPSRNPGSPVHELTVGLLDALGGSVAANLGSLAAGAACVALLVRLVRRSGRPHAGLVALVFGLNPVALAAATSVSDHLFSLAFLLGGIALLDLGARPERWPVAAVVFALACGTRLPTSLLVGAVLVALLPELGWRRAGACAAVTVALGLLLFVPAWRHAGGWSFLESGVDVTGSFVAQLGRWGLKNVYLVGPFGAVVALLAVPAVVRACRAGFRSDPLVRAAVVGFVAAEALYLRFPWKLGILLPALAFALLLVAASDANRRRYLGVLVASQVLYAVVSITIIVPDNPNQATGGRVDPAVVPGFTWRDILCRTDPDADRVWDLADRAAAEDVYTCSLPWSPAP